MFKVKLTSGCWIGLFWRFDKVLITLIIKSFFNILKEKGICLGEQFKILCDSITSSRGKALSIVILGLKSFTQSAWLCGKKTVTRNLALDFEKG